MGHKVYLFLLYPDLDYMIDEAVEITLLEGKSHKAKARFFDEQISMIEKASGKIDLFVSFLQGAHKVAKLSRIPDIYMSVRNYESQRFKEKSYLKYWRKKRQFQKLYHNEKLLCVCDAVKEDLLNNLNIKPKSIETLYNPYNFEEVRANANSPLEHPIPKKFILHIGSFETTQKRQDIAIKVMEHIDDDYDLVFLGKGKQIDKYKALAKELHLDERVHFMGWDPNPYAWIKEASVLLITSDYEGFPNVLVESLIIGTPVVSRENYSGVDEILTGEYAKYIIKDDQGYRSLVETVQETAKDGYVIPEKLYEFFDDTYIAQQYLGYIDRSKAVS
jgi:glycosyltransferase involved in cell wall biosynthesis